MDRHTVEAPASDQAAADAVWTAARLCRPAPSVVERTSCGAVAELFQADPDLPGVIVLDSTERPLALADRATFLLHFSQRYGRDLYARRPVIHLADRHPLLVALHTGLSDLNILIAERKPDALHRGFVLVDPDGRAVGLGQGIDVMRLTAEEMARTLERLRATQRDLIQSEKMAALGGLVAGVAHEINTPLGVAVTAATAFAQDTERFSKAYRDGTLRRSDLQDYVASAGEAMGFVLGNITRAADLVHSFKQVAVDQTTDQRRRFDLGDYLGEVLRSLQPQLRRLPHRLDADLVEGQVVESAPGAIAQIVTNLVMNALTHAFTGQGRAGTICVSLCPAPGTPGWVQLSVTDDGQGIEAAILPRIFDPFFTTRREAGGTGLGLHLVYNLVTQRLGGRIDVESRVGQGTRFTVAFPRRSAV
ncbi:sensor histidine kinase [Niveispirillum lacus]|uniref:sensor histidine kinase n=1 Tax=Niveispirillum lacus TaxID=1981099 RepID=UPI0013FD9E69|nr:HAMP domain-containing sensor histidine kinase [Niveispirillum lacus]